MNTIDSSFGPGGRFLDQFMPTEPPVYRVTDIDFERWASEGVTTIISDVEACLGETGSTDLVPEYAGALYEARAAGIANIALQTNKAIRTTEDRELLRGWGEQASADLVLTPLAPNERKPSPVMTYKAMEHFGVDSSQVGVIDDKASAGIRGGFFAGTEHRAWTRAFGENRHIGDRVVRDPVEAAMRLRAHLLLTPKLRSDLGVKSEPEQKPVEDASLAEVVELFANGTPDHLDNIVGFGVGDIQLSDDILSTLRQPAYRRAINSIKSTLDYYGEQPAEKLKAFLYEHGRTTADSLTYSRLAIAGGLIAVNRRDMDEMPRKKLETALVVLAHLTDGADGPSARAHKNGATKKGGDDDHNIDKVLALATDIFTMLPKELIDKLDIGVEVAREVGITAIRRPFAERGIDTKSIWSGKAATFAKAGAQIGGLTLGNRYPRLNKGLQRTATGLKVASLAHAPFVWAERHEQKQHEHNNLARLAVATATEVLEA